MPARGNAPGTSPSTCSALQGRRTPLPLQGTPIDSETQGVALGWSAAALSAPESKLCESEFASLDGWPFVRWLLVSVDVAPAFRRAPACIYNVGLKADATRSTTVGLWRRPYLQRSQVSLSLCRPSEHTQSIAFSSLPERGAAHPSLLVAPLRRPRWRSPPEWARPPAPARSHRLWAAPEPSLARQRRGW